MDISNLITNISSNATLIPIGTGLLAFKSCTRSQRAFLFYLIVGFSVDLLQFFVSNDSIQKAIYNFYAVFEIYFAVWFIRQISSFPDWHKKYTVILYLVIPLWLFCHHLSDAEFLGMVSFSKWFDGITGIVVSALTVVELLELVNTYDNKIFRLPQFWFLGGLFTYFFCTFFIFFLIESVLRKPIWNIHNMVNVIECLIFARAFYLIYKNDKQTAS